MKLESARELKSAFVRDLTNVTNLPLMGAMAFDARRVATLRTAPTVALGVSPSGKRNGDFKVAVRLQRRGAAEAAHALKIEEKARGEVDVRYVGRINKRTWFTDRHRPLQLGISVAHFRVTAGTIGAFTRGPHGSVRILSNNHVLADENAGKAGDDIVQPGTIDGGERPRDRIGELDKYIKLKTGTAPNAVDCAVAAVAEGIESLLNKLYEARTPLMGVLEPDEEFSLVEKWGRTTGHTRGRVSAFELDNVIVGYDLGNLRFDGQLEIEPSGADLFSDGGDSGSLIMTRGDRLAVGLLFAGSQTGGSRNHGLTYANPIHSVLRSLRTELLLS